MNHGAGEQAPHRRKNVVIAVGFDGQTCGGKLHSPFFMESARCIYKAISQSIAHQAEKQACSGELFPNTLSTERRKKAH
ncbi:hypothetical protein IB274_03165 [Pseudomonas sp. PDM18]|nr:hypothetical protein [Pseudomonas sp. PDM18]